MNSPSQPSAPPGRIGGVAMPPGRPSPSPSPSQRNETTRPRQVLATRLTLPGVGGQPVWLDELERRLGAAQTRPSRRSGDGAGHRTGHRFGLAPQLAYGRHRGPAPAQARAAAVLIALYRHPHGDPGSGPGDGLRILLTRRPLSLRHHGGQICLPGGRLEHDETTLEAALREYREELGVAADLRRVVGRLSDQYVYASGHRVTPWLIWMQAPVAPLRPDPAEVDALIELPVLEWLADRSCQGDIRSVRPVVNGGRVVGHVEFKTPAICWADHCIWGATAMILDELAHHLLSVLTSARDHAN